MPPIIAHQAEYDAITETLAECDGSEELTNELVSHLPEIQAAHDARCQKIAELTLPGFPNGYFGPAVREFVLAVFFHCVSRMCRYRDFSMTGGR